MRHSGIPAALHIFRETAGARPLCKVHKIEENSTLHVLNHDTMENTTPMGSAFPTGQEAFHTMDQWKAIADNGSFDADTHIVDPQAHFVAQDAIQKTTIESSQFYRQSGTYGPSDISSLSLGFQGGDLPAHEIESSLFKTYLMVHSLIESFNNLRSRQFCTSFFSILVERCDGTIAEIVKILKQYLSNFGTWLGWLETLPK